MIKPWCSTCGKDVQAITCDSCFVWWKENLVATEGAEKERAKIVAWLRSPHQSNDDKLNLYLADEIQAGEHLK